MTLAQLATVSESFSRVSGSGRLCVAARPNLAESIVQQAASGPLLHTPARIDVAVAYCPGQERRDDVTFDAVRRAVAAAQDVPHCYDGTVRNAPAGVPEKQRRQRSKPKYAIGRRIGTTSAALDRDRHLPVRFAGCLQSPKPKPAGPAVALAQ